MPLPGLWAVAQVTAGFSALMPANAFIYYSPALWGPETANVRAESLPGSSAVTNWLQNTLSKRAAQAQRSLRLQKTKQGAGVARPRPKSLLRRSGLEKTEPAACSAVHNCLVFNYPARPARIHAPVLMDRGATHLRY
jgi:hypothetical protein